MTRWSDQRPSQVSQASLEYIQSLQSTESEAQQSLRAVTQEECKHAHMLIGPEQAAFLSWLVTTMQAKLIIELGMFTGYSALTLAQAMLPKQQVALQVSRASAHQSSDAEQEGAQIIHGHDVMDSNVGPRLIACDIDNQWFDVAHKHWQQAGVDSMIEFRHGPALDALQALISNDLSEQVDLIFIDADKRNYPEYYQLALNLLRPGGVMVLDNILVNGKVVSGGEQSKSAQILRILNETIRDDPRVNSVVLPLSDGMTLITKAY